MQSLHNMWQSVSAQPWTLKIYQGKGRVWFRVFFSSSFPDFYKSAFGYRINTDWSFLLEILHVISTDQLKNRKNMAKNNHDSRKHFVTITKCFLPSFYKLFLKWHVTACYLLLDENSSRKMTRITLTTIHVEDLNNFG